MRGKAQALRPQCTALALLLMVLLAGMSLGISAQVRTYPGGVLVPDTSSDIGALMEVDFELPSGYKLQPAVDLTSWLPPAGDQGRQASCTAWALGYGLMTYRMNRVSGRQYGSKDTLDPKHAFSPAYLYNLLRMVDGQDCLYGARHLTWAAMHYDRGDPFQNRQLVPPTNPTRSCNSVHSPSASQ